MLERWFVRSHLGHVSCSRQTIGALQLNTSRSRAHTFGATLPRWRVFSIRKPKYFAIAKFLLEPEPSVSRTREQNSMIYRSPIVLRWHREFRLSSASPSFQQGSRWCQLMQSSSPKNPHDFSEHRTSHLTTPHPRPNTTVVLSLIHI